MRHDMGRKYEALEPGTISSGIRRDLISQSGAFLKKINFTNYSYRHVIFFVHGLELGFICKNS